MFVLGVWGDPSTVNVGESFLIAFIAIVIVFLTLVIIIGATSLFQKGVDMVGKKTAIHPKPQNKLLEKDEDAVVAVLTASIDFHKETGKGSRVVSVTRIEE